MHLSTSVYSHRKKDNMLCSSFLSLHHLEDLFGDETVAIMLGPTKVMKPTHTLQKSVKLIRASRRPTLPSSDAQFLSHWLDRETRRTLDAIISNPHGFDIVTDGHWKLTGSGIDDVMQSKRPWELHTAAASVVLIGRAPLWMDEGIVTIRIEHGELLMLTVPSKWNY